MDVPNPQPSVNERRGQRLAPLQTNFSRPTARVVATSPRPQRLRPNEYPSTTEAAERVPLQAQPVPVKRQTSKTALRSLFGRDKSNRRGNNEKLSGIEELQRRATEGENGIDMPMSPPLSTPKTVVSMSTSVASPSVDPRKTKASKSRSKTGEEKPPASEFGWKPPPLFQAYPQATKHDTLWAPTLAADSILRFHANGTKSNTKDDDQNDESTDGSSNKKKEDKDKKHARTLSETGSKMQWAQKIYVLTTSGHILQYAGDGKHDRLPEKMMQLGPSSVAFASDAIPGKHFVLQISQNAEDDGTAALDNSKPLLSRFGFHRAQTRRSVRTFLLVCSTPDKMSSWLAAVRAEIEARGGRKYVSDRSPGADTEPAQLETKPSLREMVTKDTNRYSTLLVQPGPHAAHLNDSDHLSQELKVQSRRSSYHSMNRRSMIIQHTIETTPASAPDAHADGESLGNGLEPPYASNNSSRRPSRSSGYFSSSPSVGNGTAIQEAPQATDSITPSEVANSLSSQRLRQSMMYPSPPATLGTPKQPRPQSVLPEALVRSASPPAPNFSVPSFSRKFATRSDQNQSPQPAHMPPSSTRWGSLQGSEKRRSQIVVEEESDNDANIAAFPSPPLSPSRSISSLGREYAGDPRMVSRDTSARRPLRLVSSEDSLIDPIPKTLDSQTQIPPRLPRALSSLEPSANHSSSARPSPSQRLVSTALRPAGAPISHHSHFPQSPPQKSGDVPNQPDSQRSRVSVYYNDHQQPQSFLRRKSLPGLSIGPPSAPPPNCPLPKLPSPSDLHAQPGWPEPSAAGRLCKSPPPVSIPASRKNSTSSASHAIPPDGLQRLKSPSPRRPSLLKGT